LDADYSQTARYYDKVYAWKDYAAEAERLVRFLGVRAEAKRGTLLDVACGTGLHLKHLKKYFDVEGLDLSPEQLAVARERNPGVLFHVGDMTDFSLGRSFDVVTCLFSSIGYAKTLDLMHRAVRCMGVHVNPGGVLAIEPWFTPAAWHPNTVHGTFIDQPELKIARVNTSFVEGRVSVFDLHYLIGTPAGTQHFVEHHEMGLFEEDEMRFAMTGPEWVVEYDREGVSGRGLFLARRAKLRTAR
jgi:SAM-dependent methyltransferase